jgi:DUF4097 and DUF4098 domain-containing protein YvlB
MKKVTRIALAAGLTLSVIGFAWSGFSWRNIEHDIQNISRRDYTDKKATFAAGTVNRIKANVDNVKIVIKQQPDHANKQVSVTYFESDRDKFAAKNVDGTITISRTQDPGETVFCMFRCAGSQDRPLVVYVPADSVLDYDLSADNAPVHFENSGKLQAKTVRIIASNSSVRLQDIAASGTIDIRNDNGSIEMQNVKTPAKLILSSSNAINTLTDVEAQAINSTTDNGSASLDTVTTTDLKVSTSNAAITLRRVAAIRTTLTSDNGSVEGSLLGAKNDYDIRVENANGSVELDGVRHEWSYTSGDKTAAKSLSVQASNAMVDITFEE